MVLEFNYVSSISSNERLCNSLGGEIWLNKNKFISDDFLTIDKEQSCVHWYASGGIRRVRTIACKELPVNAVFCVLKTSVTSHHEQQARDILTVAVLFPSNKLSLYLISGEHFDILLPNNVVCIASTPHGLLIEVNETFSINVLASNKKFYSLSNPHSSLKPIVMSPQRMNLELLGVSDYLIYFYCPNLGEILIKMISHYLEDTMATTMEMHDLSFQHNQDHERSPRSEQLERSAEKFVSLNNSLTQIAESFHSSNSSGMVIEKPKLLNRHSPSPTTMKYNRSPSSNDKTHSNPYDKTTLESLLGLKPNKSIRDDRHLMNNNNNNTLNGSPSNFLITKSPSHDKQESVEEITIEDLNLDSLVDNYYSSTQHDFFIDYKPEYQLHGKITLPIKLDIKLPYQIPSKITMRILGDIFAYEGLNVMIFLDYRGVLPPICLTYLLRMTIPSHITHTYSQDWTFLEQYLLTNNIQSTFIQSTNHTLDVIFPFFLPLSLSHDTLTWKPIYEYSLNRLPIQLAPTNGQLPKYQFVGMNDWYLFTNIDINTHLYTGNKLQLQQLFQTSSYMLINQNGNHLAIQSQKKIFIFEISLNQKLYSVPLFSSFASSVSSTTSTNTSSSLSLLFPRLFLDLRKSFLLPQFHIPSLNNISKIIRLYEILWTSLFQKFGSLPVDIYFVYLALFNLGVDISHLSSIEIFLKYPTYLISIHEYETLFDIWKQTIATQEEGMELLRHVLHTLFYRMNESLLTRTPSSLYHAETICSILSHVLLVLKTISHALPLLSEWTWFTENPAFEYDSQNNVWSKLLSSTNDMVSSGYGQSKSIVKMKDLLTMISSSSELDSMMNVLDTNTTIDRYHNLCLLSIKTILQLPGPNTNYPPRIGLFKEFVHQLHCCSSNEEKDSTVALHVVQSFINAVKIILQTQDEQQITKQTWKICVQHLPDIFQSLLTFSMSRCAFEAPSNWPIPILFWVHRNDICANRSHSSRPAFQTSTSVDHKNNSLHSDKDDGLAEVEQFSLLRFPEDDRVHEVCRMLNSSKSQYLKIQRASEQSEDTYRLALQNKLLALLRRPLASTVGRGMLTIGTLEPLMAEALPIPLLNLTGRIPPKNSIVNIESASILESAHWAEFHNGTAAALRLGPRYLASSSSSTHSVSRNWIIYNKTASATKQNSDNSHAGFLLGLGIFGYLDVLTITDICDYLTQGHEATTISILIGVATSKIGRADPLFSKTLCLHIPTLLPSQHWDIEISPVVQSSALIGLGFLYCHTGHRLIVEFLLEELMRKPASERCDGRESLSLSAAWALGMVLLPRDPQQNDFLEALADLKLDDRLNLMLTGGKRPSSDSHLFGNKNFIDPTAKPSRVLEGDMINTDLTLPGVCISLGLMYIQSNNQKILSRLNYPTVSVELNCIRPDQLMYRAIARCLIQWKHTQATSAWIDTQIPELILTNIYQNNQSHQKKKTTYLSPYNTARQPVHQLSIETATMLYMHLITGYCIGLGIVYAGTFDESAKKTIYEKLQWFQSIRENKAQLGFKLNKSHKFMVEMFVTSVSLALSCVMAGSGDLDCMRIIRELRWKADIEVTFGVHMAFGMSLGLLFLAGGKYSLKRDPLSSACLLFAILPRFPKITSDHQFHLQAARHFYALAIEPRVLHTIDVDTGLPVSLDLSVLLRSGESIISRMPGLLPELDSVQSISLHSGIDLSSPLRQFAEYYPCSMEFPNRTTRQMSALVPTMFVKRIAKSSPSSSFLSSSSSSLFTSLQKNFSLSSVFTAQEIVQIIFEKPSNKLLMMFKERFPGFKEQQNLRLIFELQRVVARWCLDFPCLYHLLVYELQMFRSKDNLLINSHSTS